MKGEKANGERRPETRAPDGSVPCSDGIAESTLMPISVRAMKTKIGPSGS